MKHLENRTTNPIVINVVKEKKMDKIVDGYICRESMFQKDTKDFYISELERMTNKKYTDETTKKEKSIESTLAKKEDIEALLDNLIKLVENYKTKLDETIDDMNMCKKENEKLKRKLEDTIDDRNKYWKQKTSDDYKSTCDHCKATTNYACHRCAIGWKLGAK